MIWFSVIVLFLGDSRLHKFFWEGSAIVPAVVGTCYMLKIGRWHLDEIVVSGGAVASLVSSTGSRSHLHFFGPGHELLSGPPADEKLGNILRGRSPLTCQMY